MAYLLGLDIGTSSCKSVIIDENGKVISKATASYGIISSGKGVSEIEPRTLWDGVVRCTLEMSMRNPGVLKQIDVCAVTGQMRGVIMLGSDNKPLRPAILWNDNRCVPQLQYLYSNHRTHIEGKTKNPLNTMCTLPKLMWLTDNEPEIIKKTHMILYPKDYIAFRLCGEFSTDVSDASGSSMFSPISNTWIEEFLKQAGINLSQLPDIHHSTDIIGKIGYKAAKDTGISAGVPVAAGMSDATAEMLALGIGNSDTAKIRLGTSGSISTITEELPDSCTHLYCWSYMDGHRWMLDVNTRSCGAAIEWAGKVFYSDIEESKMRYTRMIEDANQIPPGSHGILFFPYLRGEDAPLWDSSLTARFYGLRESHERGDFMRAVYEGTAFALRDAMDVFGSIVKNIFSIRFTGGGTLNKLWLTIVATVLGKEGTVNHNAGSALGAAFCGGIGLKIYEDIDQVTRLATSLQKEYVSLVSEELGVYHEIYKKYLSERPGNRD